MMAALGPSSLGIPSKNVNSTRENVNSTRENVNSSREKM